MSMQDGKPELQARPSQYDALTPEDRFKQIIALSGYSLWYSFIHDQYTISKLGVERDFTSLSDAASYCLCNYITDLRHPH